MKASFNEYVVANTGYVLANRDLNRGVDKTHRLIPTLRGVATGVNSLIPGFNIKFGAIIDKDDGNVEWPINKTGLSEDAYNYYDNLTSTLLQLEYDREAMPQVARAILNEVKGGEPVELDYTGQETMDRILRQFAAERIIYLASRVNSHLRMFQMRNFNVHDLEALNTVRLICRDSDEGIDAESDTMMVIDHPETRSSDAYDDWGMTARDLIDTRQLELVEYNKVAPYLTAYKSWFRLADACGQELLDAIKRRQERAKAYVKENAYESIVEGTVLHDKAVKKSVRT